MRISLNYLVTFIVPGSPFRIQTASRTQTSNILNNSSPKRYQNPSSREMLRTQKTIIVHGKARNSTRKRNALSNTGGRKPSVIESVMLLQTIYPKNGRTITCTCDHTLVLIPGCIKGMTLI